MPKPRNTATTHYQHVDRVHSRRIVELATGICDDATDVAKMSFADCVAEERALVSAMETTQAQLIAAKREGRSADVILIGSRIDALNRRKGACKLRRREMHSNRIGEGKRFLKAAMRDILPADLLDAVFARANELEAAAVKEMTP